MKENQLKATELRCGNLIYRYDKIVYTNIGILTKIQNGSVIYKPIQLTEDILVKLGFEKSNAKVSGSNYFTNGRCSVMTKDGIFYFSLVSMQSRYITAINFIHTLQNLFFALTGEELTFKN